MVPESRSTWVTSCPVDAVRPAPKPALWTFPWIVSACLHGLAAASVAFLVGNQPVTAPVLAGYSLSAVLESAASEAESPVAVDAPQTPREQAPPPEPRSTAERMTVVARPASSPADLSDLSEPIPAPAAMARESAAPAPQTATAPPPARTPLPMPNAVANSSPAEPLPLGESPADLAEPLPTNEPPEVPEIARRQGWQGIGVARLSISETGRVTAAAIVASTGYQVLDEAALRAIRNWRYLPARQNGKPVACVRRQPFEFRLRAAGAVSTAALSRNERE